MGRKIKYGVCAICGLEGKLTQEHIPPKNIFLKPRPKNTLTVYACEKCNEGSTLDDEYFRLWVTAGAEPDTKLGKLWEDKVVGSTFERSPALKKRFKSDHRAVVKHHLENPIETYNGRKVPDDLLEYCYAVDASRINRVLEKIVRGLYFHHFNEAMPTNVVLDVSNETLDQEAFEEVVLKRKGLVGGEEGEFIYWFEFSDKVTFHSKWILLFYFKNHFVIRTKLERT